MENIIKEIMNLWFNLSLLLISILFHFSKKKMTLYVLFAQGGKTIPKLKLFLLFTKNVWINEKKDILQKEKVNSLIFWYIRIYLLSTCACKYENTALRSTHEFFLKLSLSFFSSELLSVYDFKSTLSIFVLFALTLESLNLDGVVVISTWSEEYELES